MEVMRRVVRFFSGEARAKRREGRLLQRYQELDRIRAQKKNSGIPGGFPVRPGQTKNQVVYHVGFPVGPQESDVWRVVGTEDERDSLLAFFHDGRVILVVYDGLGWEARSEDGIRHGASHLAVVDGSGEPRRLLCSGRLFSLDESDYYPTPSWGRCWMTSADGTTITAHGWFTDQERLLELELPPL